MVFVFLSPVEIGLVQILVQMTSSVPTGSGVNLMRSDVGGGGGFNILLGIWWSGCVTKGYGGTLEIFNSTKEPGMRMYYLVFACNVL